MKTLIFVFSLAIFSYSVNAQSNSSLIFGTAVAKYKKAEITGTVLTVVGGVALFTGNVLYWKSYNDHNDGEPQENKVKTYGGIILGGLGFMAVGIPIWAVAKSKERHITIEAELVRFKGLASANGIGLKIRF